MTTASTADLLAAQQWRQQLWQSVNPQRSFGAVNCHPPVSPPYWLPIHCSSACWMGARCCRPKLLNYQPIRRGRYARHGKHLPLRTLYAAHNHTHTYTVAVAHAASVAHCWVVNLLVSALLDLFSFSLCRLLHVVVSATADAWCFNPDLWMCKCVLIFIFPGRLMAPDGWWSLAALSGLTFQPTVKPESATK